MTKPFNLEHAKAGAPVQLANGNEATIIKFDGRYPGLPLVVLVGDSDSPYLANTEGKIALQALVMAPIAMCEGKPVYYGDKLTHCGEVVTFDHNYLWPKRGADMGANWSWPKSYPTYRGTNLYLMDAINAGPNNQWPANMLIIANAAIQHGIDGGYLVDPNTAHSLTHRELGRVYGDERFIEAINEWLNKPVRDIKALAGYFYQLGRDHQRLNSPFYTDEMLVKKLDQVVK